MGESRSKQSRLKQENLGYLLAKALQGWNRMLYAGFCEAGFEEVTPSYGSILIPLFEEDGLRMGELAKRSKLRKQTMTTLVNNMEERNLVVRRPDPDDGRATLIYLTEHCRQFEPTAEDVLAALDSAVERLLSHEQVSMLKESLKRLLLLDDWTGHDAG